MQMMREARRLVVVFGIGVLAGFVVLAALYGATGPGLAWAAKPLPCPTNIPPPPTRSPCPGTIWYSTYFGGSGEEPRETPDHNIAVDSAGNVYVAGRTTSVDIPVTPGAYDTTPNGGAHDVFVAKFNTTGGLQWASYLGGSGDEEAYGIAVDSAGNAYLAGYTSSANFPTTPGAFDRKLEGDDAFVTKLSGDGSTLLYSTFLGGKQGENAWGITVDGSGSAYVTGRTYSSTFPVTPGAYDTSYAGGGDAFVTKFNPTGSGLIYSTFLGGKEEDNTRGGIAVDGFGNAYVAGSTHRDARGRNSFPTTPGSFDRTFGGGTYDGFVAKLNKVGSALVYSTYLGGSNDDNYVYGVAVDRSGNAYVTGDTYSADFPTTPGAFDRTFGGIFDAFVTKLSADGSYLVYSTYFGTTGYHTNCCGTVGWGIAVDSSERAVFAGRTWASDLPFTSGSFDTTKNGTTDAFLARLDATGSYLDYSTVFGGNETDSATGIALDPGGDAWTTGFTSSDDFPCTEDAFDTTYNGGGDAFVTRIER